MVKLTLLIFSGLGIHVLSSSCSLKHQQKINAYQFSYTLPLITPTGDVFDRANSFKIYYKDDLIMYEFRTTVDKYSDGKFDSEGFRNYYLIYKKGEKNGFKYDPALDSTSGKWVKVDSMLVRHAFQGLQLDKLREMVKIDSSVDKSKILKESYISPDPKYKEDTVETFYTDKLMEVDFSLSRILDSTRGKKLFKLKLIGGELRPNDSLIIPKRISSFELRTLDTPADEDLIKSLFQKYLQARKLIML